LALGWSWVSVFEACGYPYWLLFLMNQASDTVTLIDLATMEAYRHVAVVGGPHEVAVSPDGVSYSPIQKQRPTP
jgi:YVTN family beta-propeller protein